MNMDLKRFLTKQNDKKTKTTDQTQTDIKLFIKNYCNQKEGINGDEDLPTARDYRKSRMRRQKKSSKRGD